MSTALFLSPLSSPSPFFVHINPNPLSLSLLPAYNRRPNAVVYRRLTVSARTVAPLVVPAPTSSPDAGDRLDISKLGISEQIVSSLARRGITELFPIQRAVLEPAMEGRDMIGRAITGSGKTLAFGIPILDSIIRHQSQHRKKRAPSALILAPTRELARQVQQEFKVSAPNLSSTCLYGGVPIMSQMRDLGYGMDIVVGTPGRIIDLVDRGALDLSEVKFVVLDEADQMLDIGFKDAIECILGHLPARKQCMLFSATMPSWVNELSRKYLRNPLVIDLVGDSEQKLAEGISLFSVSSSSPNKQNLLPTLISRYAPGGKSIIFTRTKKDAESLSIAMGSIIRSRALHGNMQQLQRDRTLTAFRDGRFSVLVATDVAARGLDIPNVDLVVHFELPNTSEIFVHRSGRTGRAGNKGTAVLMFTESQRRAVRTIERDLDCKFEELRGMVGGGGGGGGGGRRELSDSEDYDDSPRQNFRRPDNFSDRRNGNYGRFQESSTSRYSQGSFRGPTRSGNNNFSRKSEPRYGRGNAPTRGNQFRRYDDDFESGPVNERNGGINTSPWPSSRPSVSRSSRPSDSRTKRPFASESRHDDFDDILDLFKDQY